MFVLSEKTQVNMTFKMLELFKTIKADKKVKTNAENVLTVTLSNVLSTERLGLEESDNVKEIYFIGIELNSNTVPALFLEQFNSSVNFQILFTLRWKDKVKYLLPIKVWKEEKLKTLKTFESDWLTENLVELPYTSKLENVFKEMIAVITTYKFRLDEGFEDYIKRLELIKKQQAEIEKQTRIMNNERQPNIKMALNDKIKALKKELQILEKDNG